MATHTPGPWELVEVPDEKMISNWHIKIGDYKVSVFPYRYWQSENSQCGGYLSDPEMMGNALRMAAASDLFEALDMIHKSFGGGNVITFSDADIAQIGAAIAKATGAA